MEGGGKRKEKQTEEVVAPGQSMAVSLGSNVCVIGHSGHSTRKESEARGRLSS